MRGVKKIVVVLKRNLEKSIRGVTKNTMTLNCN